MIVSFDELDAVNPVFADLMYRFDKVSQFFEFNPSDDDHLVAAAKRAEARPIDRGALVEILLRQNSGFGAGPATIENINKLKDPKTVAVVTGQQMGLFGGPLYTFFKALGTIRMSDDLSRKYPDHHFVPVFWMELEDHDFEEVRKIGVLNRSNDFVRLEYSDKNVGARNLPVGSVILNDGINDTINLLSDEVIDTEFKKDVISDLRECYRPGASFAEAFGHLMQRWVGRGLILFDPSDRELKRRAAPLFKKEIEDPKAGSDALKKAIRQLRDAKYPVQVETEPTNLFLLVEGERRALSFSDDDFFAKGNKESLGRSTLLKICEEEPWRLVPNVVLRPVVQDYLIPTAVYLGGPAEIAYLAEFAGVYDVYGVKPPVFHPRPFMTLVEKKVGKTLDRYGISFPDLFNRGEHVVEELVTRSAVTDLDSEFGEAESGLRTVLEKLKLAVQSVDPTLKGASDNVTKKMVYQLNSLRKKTVEAEKRNQDVLVRQVQTALSSLLPDGAFQERKLNIAQFLIKYGPELTDRLKVGADPGAFGHRLFSL